MGAIAWTAINLLLSNFMVRYADINQGWFSQLRCVSCLFAAQQPRCSDMQSEQTCSLVLAPGLQCHHAWLMSGSQPCSYHHVGADSAFACPFLPFPRYISAMGFAFDGYAQAEFTGVTYSCANGLAPSIVGFLPEFLPNTPIISTPTALRQITQPGAACVVHLDSILGYFSLYRPFWMTAVILFGYLGVLHLATFGGLMQLTKKERR